jgi:hypothetical protein
MENGNGHKRWLLQKDKLLVFSGLCLIGGTFVVYIFIREVRYEFLMTGTALCGLGIAQWGDRKDR